MIRQAVFFRGLSFLLATFSLAVNMRILVNDYGAVLDYDEFVSSFGSVLHLISKPRNIYFNGTHDVVNPWYGWQPKLPDLQLCAWKECIKNSSKCKFCRDDPQDLIVANSTSLDPGPNWVPDVTMLRRMFLDGRDADGNPWPPPLDDELCRALDDNDPTKKLLDAVPIYAAKISRHQETRNNTVMCMLYTLEEQHGSTIRAIRETWAPGCDGFLTFSNKSDPRIPAISIPHRGPEDYENMWQKIRSMWQFVGEHYLQQFDWFYIGGDDLVTFPQNLKNFLAMYNSSQEHFLGRRFRISTNEARSKRLPVKHRDFNTGGAGYVLSRPSLKCLLEHLEDPICEPTKKSSAEDFMTANCLALACNITSQDTRDGQMRERFHHFDPETEYTFNVTNSWYNRYMREFGLLYGKNSCSNETINFHYAKNPAMVRYLYHYVHDCDRRNQTPPEGTALDNFTVNPKPPEPLRRVIRKRVVRKPAVRQKAVRKSEVRKLLLPNGTVVSSKGKRSATLKNIKNQRKNSTKKLQDEKQPPPMTSTPTNWTVAFGPPKDGGDQRKICFVSCSHGRTARDMDPLVIVNNRNRKYVRFFVFTNLNNKQWSTPGWTKILTRYNHTRFGKFMGWKHPRIRSNCEAVFYMDPVLRPSSNKTYWDTIATAMLNDNYEQVQANIKSHTAAEIKSTITNDHKNRGNLTKYMVNATGFMQYPHPDSRAGLYDEIMRVSLEHAKNSKDGMALIRWFGKQPEGFDHFTSLYPCQSFAYNPNSRVFHMISKSFWAQYSTESDPLHDEILWSFMLRRHLVQPSVFPYPKARLWAELTMQLPGDGKG